MVMIKVPLKDGGHYMFWENDEPGIEVKIDGDNMKKHYDKTEEELKKELAELMLKDSKEEIIIK
jgi:hypothetical protein